MQKNAAAILVLCWPPALVTYCFLRVVRLSIGFGFGLGLPSKTCSSRHTTAISKFGRPAPTITLASQKGNRCVSALLLRTLRILDHITSPVGRAGRAHDRHSAALFPKGG
ncbi:hypothetical protein B0H11DRAFT_953769 [Mycena galericulata]|nr:hypothetical protein B0H11DRAFT_953769 [Mycena galericulata]